MAMPPVSDGVCLRALQLYEEHGNYTKGAHEGGYASVMTFKRHCRTGKQRGLHLSDGAQEALTATGLAAGEAKMGWRRIQQEDGSFHSVMWKAPEAGAEDFAQRLADLFSDIPTADPISAPAASHDDLCTLYPVMDAHFGMHAWGRETGNDDYDLRHAKADMRHAFAKLDVLTPPSHRAILLIGGDFFHANDENAETPASKHKLDVDGRHWKVLDEGVALLAEVIEALAAKHQEITVRVLRGNHDESAHLVLTMALSERYREDARIEVEKSPRDLFMAQWGKCMISAHHGDKAKPERLAMYLSDVCEFWSATRHRHCFTGHIHHDSSKDIGPLRWESLRAFCPPDSYAASMGYGARRALQSITFHKEDGIVLRALDPIQRAA